MYKHFKERIESFKINDKKLLLNTYSFSNKEKVSSFSVFPLSIGFALWERDENGSLYDQGVHIDAVYQTFKEEIDFILDSMNQNSSDLIQEYAADDTGELMKELLNMCFKDLNSGSFDLMNNNYGNIVICIREIGLFQVFMLKFKSKIEIVKMHSIRHKSFFAIVKYKKDIINTNHK